MDIRNKKEGREVEEKKMGEESKGEGLIIKRRVFRDVLRVLAYILIVYGISSSEHSYFRSYL
jgi:uncharacterized protein involved in tellurium resistance